MTAHGTQTGALFGVPPTGRRIAVTGIAIHRIRDGTIVEHRHQVDMLSALQRLGAIPAAVHAT